MNTAYLALGSNEGDRKLTLEKALQGIADTCGVIVQCSPIYETMAWGLEEQPDFLNMVIYVETHLTPLPLLDAIRAIESELGRKRDIKWGQRTIDIDILFYGEEISMTTELQIPHPRLHERKFVLVPLAAIAPDLVHPVLQKTIAEILANCDDSLEVKKSDLNLTCQSGQIK